jgi:hypothetical protein
MALGRSISGLVILAITLSGCSGELPFYDLQDAGSGTSPVGPKLATLIANLKCELYGAANDKDRLPYYEDDLSLTPRNVDSDPKPDRIFSLLNIFQEIEFVGESQFELDVTSTVSANPSVDFINPYTTATNFTLAVGGQLSDAGHRYIWQY